MVTYFITIGVTNFKIVNFIVKLQEVDVPVVSHNQCQAQLQQTRLGYEFKLHPGFICAGGEEGKDACKVVTSVSSNS